MMAKLCLSWHPFISAGTLCSGRDRGYSANTDTLFVSEGLF